MHNCLDRPIIFIGFPRTGTTIISEIFFQHEDLALISNYQEVLPRSTSINYIRRIFDNKLYRLIGNKRLSNTKRLNYFLFRPVEGYTFWNTISGKGPGFSRGFLLNESASEEEKLRIRAFFTKLVRNQGKDRLAFKITGPARLGFLHSVFPDAVFINIVREPAAAIRSLLNVAFWKGGNQQDLWWKGAYSPEEMERLEPMRSDAVAMAAIQYRKIIDTTFDEAARSNAQLHTIRYEDFVKSPEAVVQQILQLCGLSDSKYIRQYLKLTAVVDKNKEVDSYFDQRSLSLIREICLDGSLADIYK